MPLPVKISDRLLALAKAEAQSTHRSATGQIEHWATLGRAVEAMIAYGDVLALKRLGETFPIPARVALEDVGDVLTALTQERDREKVKARIETAAAGGPVYTWDAAHPGKIVAVRPDGTRASGRLEGRRFITNPSKMETAVRRVPPAKVEGRRRMRSSGVTVAWRGTPNLDDWVAYIVNGTRSKKLILAEHASERKVKTLISRLQSLSRREIERFTQN